MSRPSVKAQQSERTRAALVAFGRALFSERGYANVSVEDVAVAAGVTTGAVYHQFSSKRGLFRAVFEMVEQDVTATVGAVAASAADPWAGFHAACIAFLDASARPDVRQVLLVDGRAVLGWDEWHEIMARYGLGLTRGAVQALIGGGFLPSLPVEAITTLLFGALNEAALAVATAPDTAIAFDDMSSALSHLLESLRQR